MSGRTTGTDANFELMYAGVANTKPHGRDGAVNKINTGRYDRFSTRIYSSSDTWGQLYWFYNRTWTSFGVKNFRISKGWNTYDIDLRAVSSWKGWPLGLRLDPANTSGVTFRVDWARLYAQRTGGTVKVSWNDSQPGGTAALYADADSDPANGGLAQIASASSDSTSSVQWNVATFPPGRYWLYAEKNGQRSASIGPIYVNQRPLMEIVKPERTTGREFSAATGNAWDFSSAADVSYFEDVNSPSYGGGYLTAWTASADPRVYFPVRRAIDTNRYHWLSFSTAYSGGFDYGLGTMARIIWSPLSHFDFNAMQTGNDIVTYPRWTQYVFDMKKMRLDHGSIGWNGTVNMLRFDPLETPPSRRFLLDYVRLTADNEANTTYDIRWVDRRRSSLPTKISWYYDSDRSGYNGRLIKAEITQLRGTNRLDWNTRSLAAGKYFVYFVATDGYGVAKGYSKVPVYVRR